MTDEIDDARPQPGENLPPMTASDTALFVQNLCALTLFGVTRFEFHPARWRLIFTSLILHRAFPLDQVRYIDGEESVDAAVCVMELATENGAVRAMLMQRQEHADETDEERGLIDANGPAYPVPEESPLVEQIDPKIWMPS